MKKRILIVEDSVLNQKILKKNLQEEYEILQAYNGKEALYVIEQEYQTLSAIILDLHMPELDGKELMAILQKNEKYRNLPILVATGEDSKELERQCLKLGAWDFVMKPYDTEVLRLRLNNIIGRSQVQLLDQIKRLSERDYLTDLYNRRYFMQRMRQLIETHQETTFSLIRMDIDNFRLYNSSFGSEAGDQLLLHMAGVIRQMVHPLAVYGRIESDIFCICAPYKPEIYDEELPEVEKRIHSMCVDFRLRLSVGIYVIHDITLDAEKMYSFATTASRACKRSLNSLYKYYTDEMRIHEETTQRITNEFETAIREQQFQVYLQPKYALATECACGAEALVRWKHPQDGMVSPGVFIPVYEKNGQIIELDYYMWENVCKILHKWIVQGEEPFPISVNISRISMYSPQIVDQLLYLTDKYQVPRQLLNLEITESAYMSNPDLMKRTIQRMRQLGFLVLMDDFGSGYSSLNTLKDIEVDILKVDMKFLPTGTENVKSEKILASVIRMAGWIGMPVVVEGVEKKEQKDFLDSIGCSYVQGYYYARPMSVEDYEELISQQKDSRIMDLKYELPQEKILDAIWSSDTQSVALLKSVSIPFVILEYDTHQIEMLRMNQSYIQEFGVVKRLNQFMNHQEWYKFLETVEQVVISKNHADCECLFILDEGMVRWYRIRLFFIGDSVNTSILSATFSNVTIERKLEKELNTVFGMLRGKVQKKGSILIIDDSEVSREILAGIFGDEYEILEARDGQEGLDLLSQYSGRIAAILLDLMMPRMSGKEFLFYKNQMARAADIPVIVISADTAEDSQINMLENGVNDYVTKPFISALVLQRVKNVLEYSSRFRSLLSEYQRSHEGRGILENDLTESGYSIQLLREIMRFLGEVFELVRLVDPTDTCVVNIRPDGTLERVKYSCFQIWERNQRCENCSSLCAMKGHCVKTKYELLKNDVFYVVSRPVEVFLTHDISENLVLEIASRVSNEQTMKMLENGSFLDIIENTQKMIYTDPLTDAFNRRFMEEMLFLSYGQNGMAKRVGFIMLDLYKFKKINDLFGHQIGDGILKQTVEAIKGQVRHNDSVVRYGGDEFFVIMKNCEEVHVIRAIERIRKAIYGIVYGPNKSIHTQADFGYSYTENFDARRETLSEHIKRADQLMYEDKRIHNSMKYSEFTLE